MKRIKYILFSLILILFGKSVYADHIYNVNMDIYLDELGNAKITEIWDVQADSGTEWYKQLYNIGNEELTDFKVSMDGKELIFKEWDVDESLSEKKGFYGINYVSEGLELCFGKGDMQRHKFTLTYSLSNFIFNTSDSQVLYQTLLPNVTLDTFYVKVHSFYNFPQELDVWGYGYEGYAYVYDGYIEMSQKEDKGLNGEYVVLLVKFPKDTFKTVNSYEQFENFDSVYNMAQEGSFRYDKTKFSDIIAGFFSVYAIPFIVFMVVAAMSSGHSEYGTKRLKFSKDGKKLKDVPYFRDIPCNKNIFRAYWIACQYNLIKNKTDFLGAILLRWLKNDNIANTTVTSKILKKEERAIQLLNSNNMGLREIELYNMMMTASKDGVLESNEFKKWCSSNYKKILNWFSNVIDDVTNEYVNEGLITPEKKTFSTIYNVDDRMKETAMQMAGLKEFLNEFSNISDRESIDVKLWEEYLIFAQIFGIAEKVAKEFKKLYPDVITDDYYNDIIFIHHISYEGVHAASVAKSRAESYSSGGGGFSSGGGGGGSFGGGGGMGGR